ncbi:hypothetical protein F5B21DRAFT_410184 [Xylaria acuta]|nr:hypothetical protein F5B21DRAFT_410184 [Xylaria acuta]
MILKSLAFMVDLYLHSAGAPPTNNECSHFARWLPIMPRVHSNTEGGIVSMTPYAARTRLAGGSYRRCELSVWLNAYALLQLIITIERSTS